MLHKNLCNLLARPCEAFVKVVVTSNSLKLLTSFAMQVSIYLFKDHVFSRVI